MRRIGAGHRATGLLLAVIVISATAIPAALGAHSPGPRRGFYGGKTTSWSLSPNEINHVGFQVAKRKRGLAMVGLLLELVGKCVDGRHVGLAVEGKLPHPVSIPATLHRSFSAMIHTFGGPTSVEASGIVQIDGHFVSRTSATGTVNWTVKRRSDGMSCTTGTRTYNVHRMHG